MARQNAVNLDITNNTDGVDISGGTTNKRRLRYSGGDIELNGSGSNTYVYPVTSDTLLGRISTDTVSNKTLNNTNVATLKASNVTLQDATDTTKQAKFDLASIGTGTTKTFTLPNVTDTIVTLTATQSLSNKALDGSTSTVSTLTGNVIPSTNLKASLEQLDDSITKLNNIGISSWGGSGDYYSVQGSPATLSVLRAGTGYIAGKKVTWSAPQTTSAFTDNTVNYVYIDSTGTIQSSTSKTTANTGITLFTVLDDGTNHSVVREDRPVKMNTEASEWIENVIGPVLHTYNREDILGADITRVATGTGGVAGDRQLKIVGNAVISDHGLSTPVLDTSGAAITINWYYTNASGKWIRYSQATEAPMYYNNAGTATVLSSGYYGIYTLYVSKDDANTSTPTYYGVMHTAQFASSSTAATVVNALTMAIATNELKALELAQLGMIIVRNSGGGHISSVTIAKRTFNSGTTSGNTSSTAASVNTSVANFTRALTSADTTVQIALETLSANAVTPSTTDTLTNKTLSTGSTIDANVTVTEVLKKVYPVGSVYISVVSTSPATLFGFGTWAAFGAGRTLVGIDAGQTEFDVVEETGGAKTVTLDTTMIPSHTHTQDAHTHTQTAHTHTQDAHTHTQNSHTHNTWNRYGINATGGTSSYVTGDSGDGRGNATEATTATNQNATATNQNTTATNNNTTATNQSTGGGLSHNNLPPYIVTYMWKRTV